MEIQIPKMKNKGKKRAAFHNKNRNSVRITVLVFFLVHLGFYLTGFLPDQNKYSYSAFRTSQNLSDYKTVTLIRWEYSPRDRVMELVFDLKNTSYSEGKIEFEAIFDNTKNLESQVVYSEGDMLIIQLYKIPKQTGRKVTVTFEFTPLGDKTYETSFYSYTGIIDEVDSLPVLSEDEYYLARQDYDIAYYQGLIDGLEETISKNENSIANIRQEIERLQGSTANLTTDELLNLSETIENDKNRIDALEAANREADLTISSYQETIHVLEQRKAAYERENR